MFCLCRCHLIFCSSFTWSIVAFFTLAIITWQFCPIQYKVQSKNAKAPPRIINGQTVEEDVWPFMASLMFYRQSHFCGGSVWNSEYILTAAHCCFFKNGTLLNASLIFVYLGHVDIDRIDAMDLFPVAEIIPHPQYSSIYDGHDIGLLRLARTINFTRHWYVYCTNRPEVPPERVLRDRCYAIGWGTTDPLRPDRWTSVLQDAQLPLLEDDYCRSRLTTEYHLPANSFLCAGYKDGHRDSCSGDSGSPLMCAVSSNPYIYQQVGIVSFGKNCSLPDYPGFYTRVDAYLDWIYNVTDC